MTAVATGPVGEQSRLVRVASRLGWAGRLGEGEAEAGARASEVLGPDLAAVGFDDSLGDGQAEAGAASAAVARFLAAVEAVEDPRQVVVGNAVTAVEHVDPDAAWQLLDAEQDRPTGGGVADGVVNQVVDDAQDARFVEQD